MSATTLLADRYRLTRELGRGGMGVVWEAYDELLHRDVAVKEVNFPPDLSEEDRDRLAARTLREARAVAAVDTHAAVRVFDILDQDGRPWIVMEMVRGRSLTAVLRERSSLPAQEVARIGLAVLEALEAAHAAGVLHRDVKPGNVLIGDDGRVALTDFGIATVDGDGGETTSGVIVGSPAYVAPERVNGDPSTPASDLWALGATLWTAAEGRPPYAGDNAIAVMSSVTHNDPPPCRQCGGPLADLLRRLMDRDPQRRPDAATAREVLARVAADPTATLAVTQPYPSEELPAAFDRTTVLEAPTTQSAPAPRPVTSPPVSSPSSTAPPPSSTAPPRRRRWLRALSVAVVVAVAAVTVVLLSRGQSGTTPGEHHRTAGSATRTAIPGGWTRYTDPTLGWSVGVPPGWQRSTAADGTRFTDPAGGRYFLVASRQPAGSSAIGAWRDAERAFRATHQDYQRLRLESIDVSGARDAADWEFTYVDGGAALHALDRAMVFGHTGYGLFRQSHTDQWDASQSLFDRIEATFQPG